MTFHTGHRHTPAAKRARFGAGHPTAAAEAYPPAAALRSFAPPVFDQGETETCYGHASSSLIVVALAAAGTPLGFVPSPLKIARNALCEEQPLTASSGLADVGADLADVMTSLAREGVGPIGALAPGRYSDVTPGNIVLRPTLADDVVTARALLLGPEQLNPTASDFAPQLATSIANLRCGVSLGIHANAAFQRYAAGAPAITDTSGFTDSDGHDVALLDYRTNPTTGELELWLLSSWSAAFGDAGGACVSASWLLRGGCLEAWRFRVAIKGAS